MLNSKNNTELYSLDRESELTNIYTDTKSTRDKSNEAPKPPRRVTRGNVRDYAALNNPWKTTRSTHYIKKSQPTKIRRGFAIRAVKADIQPIPNAPTTVDKALNRPNGTEWRKAFEEELNSHDI